MDQYAIINDKLNNDNETYLVFNPFPNDSGHLVSIDINDWLSNLNSRGEASS